MRTASVSGQVRAWTMGRWGVRHPRTNEMFATITAELVYDVLLRQARASLHPYARGDVSCRVGGRTFDVGWQIRPNRIWRFGRVFLICAACGGLATRLYFPRAGAPPYCRRCWNLTYECQQLSNYKDDVGLLRKIGLTSRNLAWSDTWHRRTASRRAARERAARRRELPWWRAATDTT